MTSGQLHDDPSKDYRKRYSKPLHWDLDPYSHFGMDYEGYVGLVLSLLPASPAYVLDAGCGDGFLADQLIRRGHRVWGIDYSEMAIGFARTYVPQGRFCVADLRQIAGVKELAHQSFDLVLLVETLEHIPPESHESLLRSLRDLLRPGGQMIMTVPSTAQPLNRWHYKHFSLEEVRTLMEASGFTVREVLGQHRRSLLFSGLFWRLITNGAYDLLLVRRLLRPVFFKYYNRSADTKRVIRLIILAQRT